MNFAVQIENLQKTYLAKEPVNALNGVSLDVPEGRIYGLLGPNGAGKSTLVKILSTVTKPSLGRALIYGHDVVKEAHSARKKMAVVLQQTATETLLTVRDNLLIYAYLHGLTSKEARKRVSAVAEEFELTDKMNKTAMDLSLGTKRRIQVAKVFMLDTPLIILDEATTGMDPIMKRNVLNRLRAEARRGRTILLTTQVLSEAEELCDNIVIIHQGKTLASGTLPELRRLSKQMFHVSLSLRNVDDMTKHHLKILAAKEMTLDQNTAHLLIEGEETSLLSKLSDLSKQVPIDQFEVKGPDLEEIFVTLLSSKSTEGQP